MIQSFESSSSWSSSVSTWWPYVGISAPLFLSESLLSSIILCIFFLSHLAFADIGYSSSVTPNMLVNFLVETNTISYPGCAVQLGSVVFFGSSECFLLAAMAYDRFVAICSPLLYSTKMSTQVYVQLLTVTYVAGFLNACSFTICFYFLLCFFSNSTKSLHRFWLG